MKGCLVFIGLLLACAAPNEPSLAEVVLATEKSEYSAGEAILVTIENSSGAAVRLYHCDYRVGLRVERRDGSEWTEEPSVNGPLCPAILESGMIILAPGIARTETLTLVCPGAYRVRVDIEPENKDMTSHSIVSEPFAVRD